MDYPLKTCPYCKVQLREGDGAFELVRRGMSSSQPSTGVPVTVYSCPKCGYVELYDLKVLGHI